MRYKVCEREKKLFIKYIIKVGDGDEDSGGALKSLLINFDEMMNVLFSCKNSPSN